MLRKTLNFPTEKQVKNIFTEEKIYVTNILMSRNANSNNCNFLSISKYKEF